ncbi:MAG: efflux RND transporter periplasmic adaptor subunit [Rhodospirillales bacterium]
MLPSILTSSTLTPSPPFIPLASNSIDCRRGRTVFAILALLVVIAPGLAACGEDKKAAATHPPAPVVVAPVIRADLKSATEYVGRVVAVDEVDLRARVEGFLTGRDFREGDDVAAGSLLFSIERDPYQTAVDTATARVAEAKAEVARSRKDYERARTLFGNGNVSQKTLDQALADQQAAAAALNAREAERRKAELDLGYTRIYAPFAGRIGRSTFSVGNLVGPGSDVLATLVKLDPIYVVFNVSERAHLDYALLSERAVRDGNPAAPPVPRLRLANDYDYPHPGRFNFVDNRVDPTTGTIAVRASFDNPDRLLVPGLFVTVVVEQARPESTLLVPQAAVQEDQAGRYVLVVDGENKVEVRRIGTGERVGIHWAVTGLSEGERVIYEGIQKVRPGGKVAPSERLPAAPTAGAGSPAG